MVIGKEMIKEPEALKLPWNLTEWSSPEQLSAWAIDAVDGLDWKNPELVTWLRNQPDFDPRMLLTTITLGYSMAMYEADEIEKACYEQPVFQKISAGPLKPTAAELNKFRKENRGLVKFCLFELLKRAFRARFDLGDSFIPAGIRKHLLEAAVTRLDIARQLNRGSEGM